ncbi:MAG: hypothetical protein ABIJ09_17730 [Pseudomonadota bacterium]
MAFDPGQQWRQGHLAKASLLAALCLVAPKPLSAHSNNYPFDYDPALSENPTGIAGDLADLHAALPGLPAGLVEIEMDGIAFNYYPETLDMIQRARDSGPAITPPIQRVAQRCATHAIFSPPAILIQPASSSCQAAAQEILTAFEGSFKTCQEVEFPEVYVLDHPPGVVDANFLGQSVLLSTVEGQIALIGEALSHLDYPVGLIPDSFMPLARSVIAKVRYATLRENIAARLAAYSRASARLQSSASCFDVGASADLHSAIGALDNELSVVGQDLDQLYTDGLAQAAQDRLAVENQGRLRNDLAHPSLTDHEREMLAFYLAAIYWRMRGGGLISNPANGTVPDITYVVNIFEGIARFAGGMEDAASVGNRYAIDESYGYAEWWDMGNEPGHDQYYDLLWMTDRGRRGVNLVRQMIGDLGYDVKHLVAGGLQMGPCYYYMWYELWARNNRYFQLGPDLTTPYRVFLEMPVSSGEVCYGGAMGLGLARTLLWGRPDTNCQPDCTGRSCGSDGCGGSCGPCAAPASCTNTGQCLAPGVDAGVDPFADAAAGPDTLPLDPDSGATALDAASEDTRDVATDAGSNPADARVDTTDASAPGTRSDAGSTDLSGQGCNGCRLMASDASPAAVSALLALAMVAISRRRDRARCKPSPRRASESCYR